MSKAESLLEDVERTGWPSRSTRPGPEVFVSYIRSSHQIAQEELPVNGLGKRMNWDASPFSHSSKYTKNWVTKSK